MPTKVRMQCANCGKRIKTDNPSIVIRKCRGCNQETEFELVTKKPVVQKGKPFDIMCLRCRTVRHAPPIPKACGCGQRFERHSENETVTDILYNYFVGSNKDKGYMKVTVSREGTVWWTPPKDEFGDDIDPLIGDSSHTGSSSYQGSVIESRDDLRPVYPNSQGTTSTSKRFIRK